MARSQPIEPRVQDFLEVLESDLFKALFDPTRIQIVLTLFAEGPSNISTIAESFEQDRSVISRHLQQLERAGIVHSEKKSREKQYAVDADGLPEVRAMLDRISNLLELCCG